MFKEVGVNEVLEKMENIFLMLDEIVDQGYILEINPEVIGARTLLKDDNAFQGKVSKSSLF
jgi:hypothetical protein